MRIPRPRSTTPRHSHSGLTATRSARISCFVERASLHIAGDDRRQHALEEARDALLAVGDAGARGRGGGVPGPRSLVPGRPRRRRATLLASGGARRRRRCLGVQGARARALRALPDAQGRPRAGDSRRAGSPGAGRGARTGRATRSRADDDRIVEEPHRASMSGRAELEQALDIALAADSPIAATTLNNLAVLAIWEGDWRRAYELYLQAEQTCRTLRRPRRASVRAWEPHLRGVGDGILGRSDRRRGRLHRGMRGIAALRRRARPRRQGFPATGEGRPHRRGGGSPMDARAGAQSPGSPKAHPHTCLVGGGPRASGKRGRGSSNRRRDDLARTGARPPDQRRKPSRPRRRPPGSA